MGMHGGGWFAYIRHDKEADRPEISRELLLRVWEFAQPYWLSVLGLLITILLITGLSLISPLLYRNLIDYAIPSAAELCSFETSNTETDSPRNPLGAKGIGESGTIGSTPAMASG